MYLILRFEYCLYNTSTINSIWPFNNNICVMQPLGIIKKKKGGITLIQIKKNIYINNIYK